MRFLFRTGLVTSVVVAFLALVSVSWAEYSARGSCAGNTAPTHVAGEGSTTLIDEVMPVYQIGEKHSIFIEAPPERVFESFERAGGYQRPVVGLFGLLATIVGNGDAPRYAEEKSMYEELRSGPDLVLEEPNREVVAADIGTEGRRASSAPDTAREFAAYRLGRGEMKGAVNLRVESVAGGSRLTTETLMLYGNRASCLNFGRYWGAIYPGSSLLRIELLKTLERRAEEGTASSEEARTYNAKTAIDGVTP